MAIDIKISSFGLDYVRQFTEAYRSTENKYLRETRCERVQFPKVLVAPRKRDLLVGKRLYPEIGYSVQYGGLGYYARFEEWDRSIDATLDTNEKAEWVELKTFWAGENTAECAYCALPKSVKERVPHRYETSPKLKDSAYTLYRMAGLQLDFETLLKYGISGLEERLNSKIQVSDDSEAIDFYHACIRSLETLRICAEHYLSVLELEQIPRTEESIQLAKALRGIIDHAPASFHEALQLVMLVATVTATNNFGRLDDVLGPYLSADLDSEVLSHSQALELMQNFYTILEEEIFHTDARITIGGMGRKNEVAADRFAMLAMETTESLNLPLPQVTLRFHAGQNPDLLNKAYDVIGTGKTFPMLYNDSVNVPAVESAFHVDPQVAEQYLPFGCGEYIINHQSCGTPNAIINLQRCLESAINHGRCLKTNRLIGPDVGGLEQFEDFEAVWAAYTQTVEYFLEPLAVGQASIYQTTGNRCPFSLISLLFDDCVEKGRDIFAGGIKHLGGSNETYGNVNTADSLLAIKKLVFEQKTCSGETLLKALKDDWKDQELLQKTAKELPKFGNDNDVADAMMKMVHNHVCVKNAEYGAKTDLDSFLVVIINNNHNTVWGLETSASADGRKHGEPLAPGNAPGSGCDRRGLTAALNSQARPDPSIHAGSVQNIKLSPSFPRENKILYHTLFNTYFERGGTQAMITVANRDDLLSALEAPEKYNNLLVRVGGFSARFIDLDPDTQGEIISRTEHN